MGTSRLRVLHMTTWGKKISASRKERQNSHVIEKVNSHSVESEKTTVQPTFDYRL